MDQYKVALVIGTSPSVTRLVEGLNNQYTRYSFEPLQFESRQQFELALAEYPASLSFVILEIGEGHFFWKGVLQIVAERFPDIPMLALLIGKSRHHPSILSLKEHGCTLVLCIKDLETDFNLVCEAVARYSERHIALPQKRKEVIRQVLAPTNLPLLAPVPKLIEQAAIPAELTTELLLRAQISSMEAFVRTIRQSGVTLHNAVVTPPDAPPLLVHKEGCTVSLMPPQCQKGPASLMVGSCIIPIRKGSIAVFQHLCPCQNPSGCSPTQLAKLWGNRTSSIQTRISWARSDLDKYLSGLGRRAIPFIEKTGKYRFVLEELGV